MEVPLARRDSPDVVADSPVIGKLWLSANFFFGLNLVITPCSLRTYQYHGCPLSFMGQQIEHTKYV